jgi:transcriptional regulator with XRE-family HTH domain
MTVPTSKTGSDFSSDFQNESGNQDFGKRLTSKRKLEGLSQDALALKIGTSKSTVQRYEKGELPKGDKLLALSFTLDCSLDWLLKGEGGPSEPSSDDKKVSTDNIHDLQHDPIIREFDDKEFALEINQALMSVEKTSLKEFYKLGGYIKALSESGIEMRTEPNRSQSQQYDPDVWDGTERRSGEDRRKSVSEELPPAQKK